MYYKMRTNGLAIMTYVSSLHGLQAPSLGCRVNCSVAIAVTDRCSLGRIEKKLLGAPGLTTRNKKLLGARRRHEKIMLFHPVNPESIWPHHREALTSWHLLSMASNLIAMASNMKNSNSNRPSPSLPVLASKSKFVSCCTHFVESSALASCVA